MSSDPSDPAGRSQNFGRRSPTGSQGASRGGRRPEDEDAPGVDPSYGDRSGPTGGSNAPFGGYPFGNDRARGGRRGWGSSFGGGSTKFLGLPVGLIYAFGAAILAIVIVGAVCGRPTATGSIAGQVKALSADRSVTTVPGAQIVVRGPNQTYTATSTDVAPSAEGEAAYNYRIENVPPGKYTMAVTPPPGSNLQPEQDISFEVESGQLYPQSVMLLADGIQKPRALSPSELRPGEAGGYINDRGERIVYQQGGGFDATDALLLYLLWRNPGGWGYGYPPVIVNAPSSTGSSGYNYRVSDPPTQTRSGQTVTQQKPSTPGQGATRPSSASGATGAGPSYSSGSGSSGSSTGTSGSSGSSGSTTTRPSTSSGSGSSVSAPSVPSQGASRPSSSSSSPSRSSAPSRSSSGSSSGGRR